MFHRGVLAVLLASWVPYATAQDISDAERFSIPLEQINGIIQTEASGDYGEYDDPALTDTEQEALWLDSTVWQWSYNLVDRTDTLGRGYDFSPYVVCSKVPGLSGVERFDAIYQMLEDAAVDIDSGVFEGDSMYNDDDMTCRSVSAETAVFRAAIDTQPPEVTQYLQVQPMLSAMKMIEGTFQGLIDLMNDYDCTETGTCEKDTGGVTVVSSGYGGRRKGRFLQENGSSEDLTLVISLSPIVLYYLRTNEVSYETIINELLTFATGDNGMHVAEASFYDFSVDAGDMVTDRMMFYSNVVNNVTSMTTAMGSNECLDNALPNDVKIARMGNNETVSVRVETISSVMTEQELDDCLWYLVHSLTLHPYVKYLELEAVVVPLPEGPGDTSAAPSTLLPAAASMLAALAVSAAVGSFLSI
eukprot:CAMPEP_0178513796 /NCGR_PEP_ID=MMETSP0696-20121128/23674_1 /TAXON_ID=265572 /ORGANISM="Extubocellulus spinifer, Strain CCMP396" /LENGTH=415 /DNA_ID=CAMNT_0020143835 /DNA_START=51 /DNA_END=1298 /DNA_ORIENTATION=+